MTKKLATLTIALLLLIASIPVYGGCTTGDRSYCETEADHLVTNCIVTASSPIAVATCLASWYPF